MLISSSISWPSFLREQPEKSTSWACRASIYPATHPPTPNHSRPTIWLLCCDQSHTSRLSPLYVEREHRVHDRRTTVHVDGLAGNEARFIHAQQHHGVANISRRAQPAHRGPAAFMPGANRVLNLLRQNS